MAKQFKPPEYEPYSTPPIPAKPKDAGGYYLTKEELIEKLTFLIEDLDDRIVALRTKISGKTIVNTGRDTSFSTAINDVFDEGTQLPLIIYEVAAGSADSKHQYLADAALSASRGISGDYSLDVLDVFKMAKQEATGLLAWLNSGGLKDNTLLYSCEQLVESLTDVTFYADLSNQYSRLNPGYYRASKYEQDDIVKATAIQQEAHENIEKLNSVLSTQKRNWIEVSRTSDTLYTQKLTKLDTTYAPDSGRVNKILLDRASIIKDASKSIFQVVGAGNSLREDWNDNSAVSSITPADVVSQAYVMDGGDTSGAMSTLSKFTPTELPDFPDLAEIFVRRQGYTHADVLAIVDMLNSLPDTATFIRAGIIAVKAEFQFVQDLIDQINNMPPNTTLISGGMIALTGAKQTLQELQDAIEAGEYASDPGYQTAQEVIQALNEFKGFSGGTIIMPGVIGLSGSEGITKAIIDAINASDHSTLIGGGIISVNGESLIDRADIWDGYDSQIYDAQSDANNANRVLSYWQLLDKTLIDGSKVFTGDVLADSIRVGRRQIGSDVEALAVTVNGNTLIDLGSSKYICEIRTVDTLTWPPTAEHLRLKIQTSSDGDEYRYVHGSQTTYLTLERSSWSYIDIDGDRVSTPILIPMDGNSARWIKITFSGWTDTSDVPLTETFSATYRVFGSASWIDGGTIMAETLMLGSFNSEVTDILDRFDLAELNFNTRNDRNSVQPHPPDIIELRDEQNVDSTSNLTLVWEF